MTKAIANQDKVQALRAFLAENRDRIAHAILPSAAKYLTPDRVCRVVLIAATKTPALLACTPTSIVFAAMQAASYGLEPGGALGEAALVPYGDQCSFQFQYRGLITLAMRHGDVLQIDANVIREGDRWIWREGLDPRLDHEPNLESSNDHRIIAAYAIAVLPHGKKFCVVPRAQLDKAQALSKSPAWQAWPEEMSKKVAIKRLLKTVQLTPEVADAVDADNAQEQGIDLPMPEPKPTRTERAREKLSKCPHGMPMHLPCEDCGRRILVSQFPPPKDSGEASVDAVRKELQGDRTAEGEPMPPEAT